jgi:poly-gamma-glutamate synthesis protein (capsule biosynthesis protein)
MRLPIRLRHPFSHLLFFTLYFLLFTFYSHGQEPIKDTATYDTLTLAIVGDLMCHAPQFNAAKKDSGYDFRSVYAAVKPYLEQADLTFGNLETVTAGEEEKFTGYPQFNTPVEYLDALKDAGFDVLTTANNHSLDRRFKGVERTIYALDSRGFKHTGTFRTEEERARVLIVEKNNIRLAVLAYTYGTNGIPFPDGKKFCVNLIDTLAMRSDIARAKSMGCDQIAVFIHWGEEYQRTPNAKQLSIASFLRREGVNLILGSHPHVLQPMERSLHPDSSFFAIYSMGNFISGQRKPFTESGVIIRLRLLKNKINGAMRLDLVDYVPTYVSTQSGYRVLPVQDAVEANQRGDKNASAYSPNDQARLLTVWKETIEHLSREAVGVKPSISANE